MTMQTLCVKPNITSLLKQLTTICKLSPILQCAHWNEEKQHILRTLPKHYASYRFFCSQTIVNNATNMFELPLHKQTICALASGSGACGVAVIRISGLNSAKLCKVLMKRKRMPEPRYATYSTIYHPTTGEPLDTGLILWFPCPQSFTGEDVLELHVHGSPAVVKTLLSGLIRTECARLAHPGEFTRRAFDNDKMNLSQVEGLRDLLCAETDMQRKQALVISRGAQTRKLHDWIAQLTDCGSIIDGHIEFGDTDNVPLDWTSIRKTVKTVLDDIHSSIATSSRGMTIKSGINVALYGETNVGKSSLLNALTAENRAIVSDTPNTTRDLIEVRMDVNGFPINLIDTAGFYNNPTHRIETEAINKSIDVLFSPTTALHLLIVSADLLIAEIQSQNENLVLNAIRSYVQRMYVAGLLRDNSETYSIAKMFEHNTLIVVTKLDLLSASDYTRLECFLRSPNVVATSVVSNKGIDKLLEQLHKKIREIFIDFKPEDANFNSLRSLNAIKSAADKLGDLLPDNGFTDDVKAQYLKAALGHLSGIIGKKHANDMLDEVFENFCIGK